MGFLILDKICYLSSWMSEGVANGEGWGPRPIYPSSWLADVEIKMVSLGFQPILSFFHGSYRS